MSEPIFYSILFDHSDRHAYCAMLVLLSASMRRYHPDTRYLVFDYSECEKVDGILDEWHRRCSFEVIKVRDDRLLADPSTCNVINLSLDGALRWIDSNPPPRKMVFLDLDMLMVQPLNWLSDTTGTQLLTYTVGKQKMLGISCFFMVLDMTNIHTRQLLALARSLNQKKYIWGHLKDRSIRRPDCADDESSIEAAISLIGREGFKALDWDLYKNHFIHYGHHQRDHFANFLPIIERFLAESRLRKDFQNQFGDLRPIVFREFEPRVK